MTVAFTVSITFSTPFTQFLKSGSLHDPVLDDVRDFKVCDDAMLHLGMSDGERLSVYTVVAAVLHLGNIQFEDNHEDTRGKTTLNTHITLTTTHYTQHKTKHNTLHTTQHMTHNINLNTTHYTQHNT